MKKTIISLMLLLIATCGWAQKVWNNPLSFCDSKDYPLTPSEVEFKKDETIVHMHITGGGMICFPNYCVLKDQDGKTYAIKSGEPTRSGEDSCHIDKWLQLTNGAGNYSLHFEPLPETTERIHFIESYDANGFRIWNIRDSKATKDMTGLFNSNWRDEQTGDWVLSLFNGGAVYNNRVCSYDEKSEKKVVINNGQEKITIAIGKEKDGKRVFTINGQKRTLANFGSALPAYPTEDNTAFSTENNKGEALIIGWVKDFPKEISDKKIKISANVKDILTNTESTVSETTFDEIGQFTIKVKLNGTQCVSLNEVANDVNVFTTEMVLQPGKQYYMMHDWENDCCLFMGDDARLQNELQTFPCKYDWQHVSEIDAKVKQYDAVKGKLNDIVAKNPTLSKRYRDYTNERNRFSAAQNIIRSQDLAEGLKTAGKFDAINPALPLSLTKAFPDYLYLKLLLTTSNARDKYIPFPETYLSFEKEGKLKLSDSDRDFLKRWRQRLDRGIKLYPENFKTEEEYMAANAEADKICTYQEMKDFNNREDIKKVYDEWAPNAYQTYSEVIDSLYSDQQMRDFSRAFLLCQMIRQDKTIPENAAFLLDKIKDGNLKQQVTDLNNHYLKLAKQYEEAVNKVIAPSSNVEGLTDGKAIVEKLIEPYKGKIVYMDIWGTWCQPCINAIKASPKMKEAVKDYDIVYLYFTYGSEEAAWKACIGELGLTKPNYVHYNLPRKQQEAVVSYLGVDGYPFYVLFDKQGNKEILDRGHIGNVEAFKKRIEELSKK